MTETRFGHFGLPGLLVAVGGLLALVLHLAVPYAYVNYRDPDTDSETLSRGEAADLHDNYDMTGASAPAVTLSGAIILLGAGLLLVALGFVPLTVTAARWSGWSLGLLAVVGGMMSFMSSMFWVGSGLGRYPYGEAFGGFGGSFGGFNFDSINFLFGGLTGGFTALIELALQTDSAGTVIIIGPILVALASALAILCSFTLCGNVISTRDGLRERASRHLGNARLALAVLFLTLLLPWSIGKTTDYEGEGDRDWFVFGAHTIMNANSADSGTFDGMTYALNVLIAAAWSGVLLGVIGSLGGVLASENAPPALARAFHYATFGTMFMTAYAGVVYILMWAYLWRPAKNVEDYQPGYFPVLLLPVLILWGLAQFRMVRAHAARTSQAKTSAKKTAVSFD